MVEKKHLLIIGESGIELIPEELRKNSFVVFKTKKLGKTPEKTLLDSSEFYKVMKNLPEKERRGRPDVIHFALTIATDSPAFSNGKLELVLHLRDGSVIYIKNGVRPPKNYKRFCGLLEQLLIEGQVPPKGEWLMKIEKEKMKLKDLVEKLRNGREVLVFDSGKKITEITELKKMVSKEKVFVVGGFPHGTFKSYPKGRIITISKKELLAASVIGFISSALGD